MKIAAVSDLEYTLAKRGKIEGIARKVIESGADAYFAAFGGSPRIGELLARHPKVTYVLNGHYMAGRREFEREGVRYLNVAMRDESPTIVSLSG